LKTLNGLQALPMTINLKNPSAEIKLIPLLHGKFEAGEIHIGEAKLRLTNMNKTVIQLNNIRLKSTSDNLSHHYFLTNLSFDFIRDDLLFSGHVVITSDVKIDFADQAIVCKNFKASLFDVILKGEFNFKNIFSSYVGSGHFTLQASHINKLIEQLNVNINNINASIDIVSNNENFDIRSNFHVKNAKIANVNFDNSNFKLHYIDNILYVESAETNLYGGYLNAVAAVNLQSDIPVITLHAKAINLQIEPLFKMLQTNNADINPNTKISGTGNVELNISTIGDDEQSLLNHLNGTSQISIVNGIIMGSDWDDMVKEFIASNNGITQEMIPQSFQVLRFKQLTGSFVINNGVFVGNDLLLESADATIKGKININIAHNFINYELKADLPNSLLFAGDYNAKNIVATASFNGTLFN
jgi:hypothetical protein